MSASNKIMIIDDNVIDQMITKHILKKSYSQCDVFVIDCPLKALSYLEVNENDDDPIPNIIMLDLDMPKMNGLAFLDHFSPISLKNLLK